MPSVISHRELDKSVIRTLLYYDIFNYPLKGSEVYRFLGTNSTTESDVITTLNSLVERKLLFQYEDLYGLHFTEDIFNRRLKGNLEAEKYLQLAYRKALLIAHFPFVRSVMASGSLSKGYMDEKSDLDFFIITEPGRLWIARMLLVMYKRLFLFNSHKHFCINYFVDYDHLEIEEKNIFTATELATVIPLWDFAYYERLQHANVWLKKFFPNYKPRPTEKTILFKPFPVKKFFEKCIDFFWGNFWEKMFMSLTLKRWKRIYEREYSSSDFSVAFKSKSYASKNHPRHYQKKITERYQQKLTDFSTRFDVDVV